jgi:iron complex transport system substrate-binding protein
MQKLIISVFLLSSMAACRNQNQPAAVTFNASEEPNTGIKYASGLSIEKSGGITIIRVSTPWPGARKDFTYALVPRETDIGKLGDSDFDAVVPVPVERLVVTSTTHIPALEALGVADRLVGFPDTRYISSPATRERVQSGEITELGSNESLNTEMALALRPEVVVGFAVGGQNRAYEVLRQSGIPVVYDGDWTEETPLGKAEWIKFFAPFFGLEKEGDRIFDTIENSYNEAKEIAKEAENQPTVLCGALFKDVWYLPGGGSWAARFLADANADYLWADTGEVGSLSLSIESVLDKAQEADFWISPSQFTTFSDMQSANRHYSRFRAFREKKVYTFARTQGETGGYLYYELAPNRPDLVLRDLIHILHPDLLPDHLPYFFKPLK